jgi:Flp pilus assembly pilin Flp
MNPAYLLKVRHYLRDRSGSAMAEYGVIASLLAVLAISLIQTLGSEIRTLADTLLQALTQVQ